MEAALVQTLARLVVIVIAIMATYTTFGWIVRQGMTSVIPNSMDREILHTLLSSIAIIGISYTGIGML